MNYKKIERISKSSDTPCSHPSQIREFAYGGPTGSFICTQCECLLSSKVVSYTKPQVNVAFLNHSKQLQVQA
jgi:hypothetical protein